MMAYVYLLDMIKFVEQRIAVTKDAIEKLMDDPYERKFLDGRNAVLLDFQDFLRKNYIPRLPRRIRETYFGRDH